MSVVGHWCGHIIQHQKASVAGVVALRMPTTLVRISVVPHGWEYSVVKIVFFAQNGQVVHHVQHVGFAQWQRFDEKRELAVVFRCLREWRWNDIIVTVKC